MSTASKNYIIVDFKLGQLLHEKKTSSTTDNSVQTTEGDQILSLLCYGDQEKYYKIILQSMCVTTYLCYLQVCIAPEI